MTMGKHFLGDRRGATAVEMGIVAMLLMILTFGIIDFAIGFYHWNTAEKATQLGVRVAVTATPVADALETFDCGNVSVPSGQSCSDPAANKINPPIVCDGATSSCSGGYGFRAAPFNQILQRMQVIYPRVQAENLVIEYSDSGLGFAGRPGGPVPAVTVRLQGLTFDFIVLSGLLGFGTITMPPFNATLTGEDLNSAGA